MQGEISLEIAHGWNNIKAENSGSKALWSNEACFKRGCMNLSSDQTFQIEQEVRSEARQREIREEELLHAEVDRLLNLSIELGNRSSKMGHKLAYYVIGIETALCGYVLLNAKIFSKVPHLDYFFLITGIAIFVGLFWLILYGLDLHYNSRWLIVFASFQKWMRLRAMSAPLTSIEEYEKVFNSENNNQLIQMVKDQQRANSKRWKRAQYFFFGAFFLGSILSFAWLIVVGFYYLHGGAIPESIPS